MELLVRPGGYCQNLLRLNVPVRCSGRNVCAHSRRLERVDPVGSPCHLVYFVDLWPNTRRYNESQGFEMQGMSARVVEKDLSRAAGTVKAIQKNFNLHSIRTHHLLES